MPAPETRRESLRELAHLFAYVQPYRRRFFIAMAASFVSMAFGAMFPFFVKYLLDAAIPSLKPVAAGAWQPDLDTVALLLLGSLGVQAVLTFFSSLAFNTVGERAVVDLRQALYARLIAQPISSSESIASASFRAASPAISRKFRTPSPSPSRRPSANPCSSASGSQPSRRSRPGSRA